MSLSGNERSILRRAASLMFDDAKLRQDLADNIKPDLGTPEDQRIACELRDGTAAALRKMTDG